MEISRDGQDLVVLGRVFLDAHLKYSGMDTIPSEMRLSEGSAFFNDDWAFPEARCFRATSPPPRSRSINKLIHLGSGESLTEKVGPGEHTEHRSPADLRYRVRNPASCIISGESLKGRSGGGGSGEGNGLIPSVLRLSVVAH